MTSDVVSEVRRQTRNMPPEDALEYCLEVIKDLTPQRTDFLKWRERIPNITPQESMFLETLWRRRPHVVPHGKLYEALYAGHYGGEAPHEKIIPVYACKVRGKLPAGVHIRTAHRVGYALIGGDIWEDGGG